MFLKKLPSAFQNDSLITNILRQLQNKNVLFSSILLNQGNKSYNIIKNQKTPYFHKDWQCYSLLRGMAKTQITSGKTVRQEKDTYKAPFAHGDKDIQEMCRNFKQNLKQNVYVMTNSMSRDQLLTYFDTSLYNLLDSDAVKKENKDKKITLKQVIQYLIAKTLNPALVSCGPHILRQYFEQIKGQKSKNLIDGGYLAYFQGQLPKQSKGDQIKFDEKLFQTVWKSDKFDVKSNDKNIGKIHFKVFHKVK